MQSIAPIVDILQAAHDRLNTQQQNGDGAAAKDETQVNRALRLSVGVRDQVVVLSSEQLKQLQQQSVVVYVRAHATNHVISDVARSQRLTDSLYNLNQLVASSVVTARDQASAVTKDGYARANGLADSTRAELDRLNVRRLPSLLCLG